MPKAYELPAPGEPFDTKLFKLGKPCKRNHIHADGMTLRCRRRRRCVLCERIDQRERQAERRATDSDFVLRERAYALNNQRRLRKHLDYRLYQRAFRQGQKVAARGGTFCLLSRDDLSLHWRRFDHCCAYCGCAEDLELEHVIPISKGGGHHLGNIVPACRKCNSSKRSRDALAWYQQQPFYSETRWKKICAILNKEPPEWQQMRLVE